jgi:phosphoenolpyruvate carboxylase
MTKVKKLFNKIWTKIKKIVLDKIIASREKLYISRLNAIYINKLKEVNDTMEFDLEKVKAFYADVQAKREQAVNEALRNVEAKVQERFNAEKENIRNAVIAEVTAEAEAPYIHDIELCEKFVVIPEITEEDGENTENVGE